VVAVPSGAVITEIMLSPKDHTSVQNQQLGEGGSFEFQNVLPGSYTATLMVVTGLSSEGQPSVKMMRVGEPIEVSTANVDRLQLQPNPGGAVRRKFRMDTGQRFDWTQLNVVLVPVDDNDSRVIVARQHRRPGNFRCKQGR
jgi:hypothetical protein